MPAHQNRQLGYYSGMTQLSPASSSTDYRPLSGTWDEMWDGENGVRPHWAHLIEGLAKLGAREWSARAQRSASR